MSYIVVPKHSFCICNGCMGKCVQFMCHFFSVNQRMTQAWPSVCSKICIFCWVAFLAIIPFWHEIAWLIIPENGASEKTKLNQFSISSQNDYQYSQEFDVSIVKDNLKRKKKAEPHTFPFAWLELSKTWKFWTFWWIISLKLFELLKYCKLREEGGKPFRSLRAWTLPSPFKATLN